MEGALRGFHGRLWARYDQRGRGDHNVVREVHSCRFHHFESDYYAIVDEDIECRDQAFAIACQRHPQLHAVGTFLGALVRLYSDHSIRSVKLYPVSRWVKLAIFTPLL